MTLRRLASLGWEFLSVSALSVVLGIGIGFFQGELSTGSQLGDIRMALPNEGAMTGALFSLPMGWVAYYLILRRKVSFDLFRSAIGAVVLVSSLIGVLVGYVTHGEAAFVSSLLMIPVVLVIFGLFAARSER
jgi:hypothetical protein